MHLLVLALSVGLASADIGLTLRNYKVPETSYGVPSYQYTGNTGYNSGSGYSYKVPQTSFQGSYQTVGGSSNNAGNYQSTVGVPSYNAGNYQSTISVPSNNAGSYQTTADNTNTQYYNQGDLNSVNTISPSSYQSTGYQQAQGNQVQYQSTSQYQATAAKKYQQFYQQWQQQPAQVFKHFYIHAAPEEPEPPKPRVNVALPAPQKHYKIIFIKAPTQTVYQPQYIPVPQANEEKTLVYVLVKKPEQQPAVQIPQVEQKAPSKPEVFFIKYNNKENSQDVINNIVGSHGGQGESVSYVNGGSSGQYQGSSGQYQEQGVSTGQYQDTTGQYQGSTGQYVVSSTGGDNSGQYQTDSSGQYQGDSSGQYQGVSGQYAGTSTGGSVQYDQGSTGGYTQLVQGVQSATADFSTAVSGSTAGSTGSSSTSNYNVGNTVSTSQGVPHENYGPPTFRA